MLIVFNCAVFFFKANYVLDSKVAVSHQGSEGVYVFNESEWWAGWGGRRSQQEYINSSQDLENRNTSSSCMILEDLFMNVD